MKIGELQDVDIDVEHIEKLCKHIRKLIAKRMSNSDKSINRKIWREEFDMHIRTIEGNLEEVKTIMSKDNWLEKDDPIER